MAGVNSVNSTGNNGYVSSYSKRSIPQKIIDFFTGTSKMTYQMKDYAEQKKRIRELQELLKTSSELQKLQKAEDAPIQKTSENMYAENCIWQPLLGKEEKELMEKLKQSSEQNTFSELLKDPVFRKYGTQM